MAERASTDPAPGVVLLRNGETDHDLTWTKAGSWHAARCACSGEFDDLDRYHLRQAGIAVVPHTSSAVLWCAWDGITMPRRGAPYGAVRRIAPPVRDPKAGAKRRGSMQRQAARVAIGDAQAWRSSWRHVKMSCARRAVYG